MIIHVKVSVWTHVQRFAVVIVPVYAEMDVQQNAQIHVQVRVLVIVLEIVRMTAPVSVKGAVQQHAVTVPVHVLHTVLITVQAAQQGVEMVVKDVQAVKEVVEADVKGNAVVDVLLEVGIKKYDVIWRKLYEKK